MRRPVSRLRGLLRRLVQGFAEHPVAGVVAVAFVVRFAVAVLSNVLHPGYLIPDEREYVEIARAVAHGQSPNAVYPGYGQSLFDLSRTFTAPLSFLFGVFGSTRLVGQVFVTVVGAAAAGVTAAIGSRFLKPGFAACAGLVVALTPSQVLFSSVVLREAPVWLILAVVALGALHLASTDWRRLVGGFTLVTLGLLGLAFLRPQTLLAASWALPLALIFTPHQRWLPRIAAALAAAAIVPWIGGTGVGGWKLVARTAPHAGDVRARLAVGARSAFGAGAQPHPAARPSTHSPPVARAATQSPSAAQASGEAAQSAGHGVSLDQLPAGIANVALRPYPWESTAGAALLFSRLENAVWYVLYALAIVGIVVSVRRRDPRTALQFPLLSSGMIIGIAALTEGNLGTAFRHREQVLWALSLFAAAGLQELALSRRFSRRRSSFEPVRSATSERVTAALQQRSV